MILLIEGSPRIDGNGAYLADKIASKNEDAVRIRLQSLQYSGCISCRKCRDMNSFCVLQDDLLPLYPRLSEADKIIIISPSYYGFVRGEVKQFIDRLYCMKDAQKTSRYKEGGKLVFLLTQGSPHRDKGNLSVEWMKKIADHSQLKYYGLTVPNCAFDNLDGIKMKEEEILMGLSFFA